MAKVKMAKAKAVKEALENKDLLTCDEFLETMFRKKITVLPLAYKDLNLCRDFLIQEGYIEKAEYKLLNETYLTCGVMLRVMMMAFGIFPYPSWTSSVYSRESLRYYFMKPNSVLEIWYAAVSMRFITSATKPGDKATRKMFRELYEKMEMGDYIKQSVPGWVKNLDMMPAVTQPKHWVMRNAAIIGLSKLPESLVDMFRELQWEFSFDIHKAPAKFLSYEGSELERMMHIWGAPKPVKASFAGLCCYGPKTIFLNTNNPATTIHEMGHFAVRALNADDEQRALFEEEAQDAFPYLRDYAQENEQEYIAVMFSDWVIHAQNRDALKKAAPKTMAFIEALASC